MKAKITKPTKKELTIARRLQESQQIAKKTERKHREAISKLHCPFETFDIIRLPNGEEGVFIDCQTTYDCDENYLATKLHFRISYYPLRGKRTLRTRRTIVGDRAYETTLVEKNSPRARAALTNK